MKKVISTVICILLALLSAISIFMIVRYYDEEKKAEDIYSDMLGFVITDGIKETQPTKPSETEDEDTVNASTEHEAEQTFSIDFEQLAAKYPDVVGWLYCEGTPINYPVFQADDNDYYLRRLPDGTYNTAGSLFADYRCGKIGETNNYIVYGHNMKNGTMFGSLSKYKTQSYYNEHPILYLLTSKGNYKIKLVAGFVSKPTGEVYNTEQTIDQIHKYCSLSTFTSNVTPRSDDNYIVLSTCSYEYENARYAVIGVLEEI